MALVAPYLRRWDVRTCNRVHYFIANSHNVASASHASIIVHRMLFILRSISISSQSLKKMTAIISLLVRWFHINGLTLQLRRLTYMARNFLSLVRAPSVKNWKREQTIILNFLDGKAVKILQICMQDAAR